MDVMMVSSWDQKCGVGEYTKALKDALHGNATVRRVPIPPMKSRKVLKRITEQINQGDVAHIQYHPDYFGYWRNPRKIHKFLFFLKQIRIPSVVTVHDLTHRLSFQKVNGVNIKRLIYNVGIVPLANWTPYGRFLMGRFFNIADHLIVHTAATKEFLQSLNINPCKISVMYPGIPDIQQLSQDSMRERYRWKDRKVMIIFGFITPQKGYEIVLNAMRHLSNDVVLLIVGGIRNESDNRYFLELNKLIVSLDLEDRVVITGYMDDDRLGVVLRESDIILLPYRATVWTGVSYALSYALAAKRPIITSDTVFFHEIEQKYSAIKTFKDGDSDALANAIMEVLNRQGREEAGASEYREMWRWKNVAERTYQIYCGLIKTRRG